MRGGGVDGRGWVGSGLLVWRCGGRRVLGARLGRFGRTDGASGHFAVMLARQPSIRCYKSC
jgi:hypothetical protein